MEAPRAEEPQNPPEAPPAEEPQNPPEAPPVEEPQNFEENIGMARNRTPPEEERQLVYKMRKRRARAEDEMGARLQAVGEFDEDGDPRLEGTEVVRGRRFIR